MKRLVLDEMTWPELKEYIDDVKIAIVPIGACEQHGPNTTFDTDNARGIGVGLELAERNFPDVLLCPCVNYGISGHHMSFPGTITLSNDTLIRVCKDIGVSLKHHGIKKVIFLCAHGGNRSALSVVVNDLAYEHGIDAYSLGIGPGMVKDVFNSSNCSPIIGHACEVETAQLMYLYPEKVRENLIPGDFDESYPFAKRTCVVDGVVYWDYSKATKNGALGDSSKATVELGKAINDLVIERVETIIKEIVLKKQC